MGVYSLGTLTTVPVSTRPELVAPATASAIAALGLGDRVGVVEIDPALSETAATEAAYGLDARTLVNCVIVAGRRGGEQRIAACLVPSHTRADINGTVRRALDVRKASFLPQDEAVAATGMEFGGITPVGLPDGWPILVAAEATAPELVLIGSGVRRSKLIVPGALLAELPGAEVRDDLARPIASAAAPAEGGEAPEPGELPLSAHADAADPMPRRPLGSGDGWVDGPDGRRFWGTHGAAGLLVFHRDVGVLLQHRARFSHFGGTWGLPGGARHDGESAAEGAVREAGEEAGVPAEAVVIDFESVLDLGWWSYTTVVGHVAEPFTPVIGDAESIELRWVPFDEVAALPLHPGLAAAWPELRSRIEELLRVL
jgi:prolyl-tRNA editing enzyme YbaK/EbsC (Cys-tRNA(Pro) deacylase)/8-oxo-dGTP pyrophosphatase MutT (NUDIX family)